VRRHKKHGGRFCAAWPRRTLFRRSHYKRPSLNSRADHHRSSWGNLVARSRNVFAGKSATLCLDSGASLWMSDATAGPILPPCAQVSPCCRAGCGAWRRDWISRRKNLSRRRRTRWCATFVSFSYCRRRNGQPGAESWFVLLHMTKPQSRPRPPFRTLIPLWRGSIRAFFSN